MQTTHLYITSKCYHDCPYCCNNNYDIENIPVVTEKEIQDSDMVCLTGGDPLITTDKIGLTLAKTILKKYNPDTVCIYTSGFGLNVDVLQKINNWNYNAPKKILLNISPKSFKELLHVHKALTEGVGALRTKNEQKHRYYHMVENVGFPIIEELYNDSRWDLELIDRPWKKEFTPAPDSIFRRLPILF